MSDVVDLIPRSPPVSSLAISEPFWWIWGAKFIGAFAGSLISVAYMLPKGRREASLRLLVGIVTGLIFGGTAGVKAADMLGLLGKVSAFEITVMGAALASLCAWWGIGVLQRVADRLPMKLAPDARPVSEKKEPYN